MGDCWWAIMCRMCDELCGRGIRYCCTLPCCNCECPCCSTNQCQEMTCRCNCCEPDLDEDYEPGGSLPGHHIKMSETSPKASKTYTWHDLDHACLACCKVLCCVPCCDYVTKKCSNNKHCRRCISVVCCSTKTDDIKQVKVLDNSIPGSYKVSPKIQNKSRDSNLYPKQSTGKTHLVSTDNDSVHGSVGDSKTNSLRSQAESEEEINREDGHVRISERRGQMTLNHQQSVTAIIEQPAVSVTVDKNTPVKQMKVARSMDSIEFEELLNSDSDNDDKACCHGNTDLTASGVKISYTDTCTNGMKIIVTDYDFGKKRSDSLSSESSVNSKQETNTHVTVNGSNEHTEEEMNSQGDKSSDKQTHTVLNDSGSMPTEVTPIPKETRNSRILYNYRQTSV